MKVEDVKAERTGQVTVKSAAGTAGYNTVHSMSHTHKVGIWVKNVQKCGRARSRNRDLMAYRRYSQFVETAW